MRLCLFLIIALALVLRLVNLNQSLWLDEAAQAVLSSQPPSYILFHRANDFHPPLFYLLSHFWLQLGSAEAWLRLLPVTFGVLSLPVLALISRELFPPQAKIKIFGLNFTPGLYSTLLLAIAPFHVYYSQEFRSYSLLTLLVLVSFWSAAKTLRSNQPRFWLIFTLANAAILYTHYSGIFYLITIFSYLFFSQTQLRPRLLFSAVCAAVLFIPWLPQFVNQANFGLNIRNYLPGWEQMLSLSPLRAVPTLMFKLIAGRIDISPRWAYGLYAAFVLGFTMLSLLFVKFQARLIYALIFGPVVSIILVSLFAPQTQPFRILFVLPFICLGLTAAAIRHPKIVTVMFLYICVFGNLLQFTRPRLMREQWRQAAEFLSVSPRLTLVKFPHVFPPLSWYAPHLNYLTITPATVTPAALNQSLDSGLNRASKLYLLEYLTEITDPSRLVEARLKDLGYQESAAVDFVGVGIIRSFEREVY